MTEEEILELIDAYAAAARRAMAAGLDGVEFHLSHGYLPWQFLSPLYNKRTDRWGGSHEARLTFPVEAMNAIRGAIGRDAFMGYRINSTSFWPGDLEIDQVKEIVRDLERKVDLDYVSVSAGVHHSFIHTPMHFEGGWEKDYAGEGPQGVVEAGAPGRPDHHPGRGGAAPQGRPRRRHLPRPPALHRPRVGEQGAGGPRGRHPPLRGREPLLAERGHRPAGAVHLQPDDRGAMGSGG